MIVRLDSRYRCSSSIRILADVAWAPNLPDKIASLLRLWPLAPLPDEALLAFLAPAVSGRFERRGAPLARYVLILAPAYLPAIEPVPVLALVEQPDGGKCAPSARDGLTKVSKR